MKNKNNIQRWENLVKNAPTHQEIQERLASGEKIIGVYRPGLYRDVTVRNVGKAQEWGVGISFDDPESGEVVRLFLSLADAKTLHDLLHLSCWILVNGEIPSP